MPMYSLALGQLIDPQLYYKYWNTHQQWNKNQMSIVELLMA